MGLTKRINYAQVEHNLLNGRNNPNAHNIASITNLQSSLNAKAESNHTHTIANVTGLATELTTLNNAIGLKGDAFYKNGNGVFTAGGNSFTLNDTFITTNMLTFITPVGAKLGDWSVESHEGEIVITSTVTETNAVSFEWSGVRN